MNIKHLLIDCDNTIYPSSSDLFCEISRRMTDYVSRLLNISKEKAYALRKELGKNYGTTLNGLIKTENFSEEEDFLKKVHPENLSLYIEDDPDIRCSLSSISIPMSIYTNSPKEHAERVVERLKLNGLFENIFDIRFSNYDGKPAESSFRMVLDKIAEEPGEVLLVDDLKNYLLPFKKIGGNILQVNMNKNRGSDRSLPSIRSIKELPKYLKRLEKRRNGKYL
jgi:putative hydrolase of the HAD superfamily